MKGAINLKIGGFSEGDKVTIPYRGGLFTFKVVRSKTGRLWADRNLGASRVAEAYDDELAYGDLFQWDMGDDERQDRDSSTIDDENWREPQNDNLWQGVKRINNPGRAGWRVPTKTEWEEEIASWDTKDRDGAFGSPLKFTIRGVRGWTSEYYQTSSSSGTDTSFNVKIGDDDIEIMDRDEAIGYSARLILDETKQL